MNVSPHHQTPTNYPWPGRASRAVILLGIVVIVVIVALVILDPWANDEADESAPASAAMTLLGSADTLG